LPITKASFVEIEQLLTQGFGVSEIARRLGVTKGTISKRIKVLHGSVSRSINLSRAEKVLNRQLNSVDQLQKINDNANELLDLLMRWNRGDKEALQILEGQVRKVRVKGSEEEIIEYKFKDPRELALKAMAEIRGQLSLQLEIFRGLFDMKAVAEFQEEVLHAIGETEPATRNRIIRALQERRVVRSIIDFT
jgi:hypothetical protein